MAEIDGYWGEGYWGEGFWAESFWGEGFAAVVFTPYYPSLTQMWQGDKKEPIKKYLLYAIKSYLEMKIDVSGD